MKKLIFIVIDGGADRPIEKLGYKTPFEVANTPNLDFLSRNGINGIMKILPIPPESDEAVLSLLGFDVFEVYTGRGPLEAIGAGLNFKDGDLALRCNFATVKDTNILDIRAGHITTEEAKELEWAINEKVKLTGAEFEFKSTVGYRGVLVIRSKHKLSSRISNTHPGYNLQFFEPVWDKYKESKGVPLSFAIKKPVMQMASCMPLERSKEAAFSARLVNEFIHKSRYVLENHPVNRRRLAENKPPANIILTRDAGTEIPKLYNFYERYGMRWACFADMPVERGIAQLCGMDVIPMPESTGDIKRDMFIRATALIRNLHFYDAFYIHLKGPDPYAHIGDVEGKIKAIEEIDKNFFTLLLSNIDFENTIVAVTCDHSTPCELKAHSEDPVPIMIAGSEIPPDNTPYFSESTCAKGYLGKISAKYLLPYLIKLSKGEVSGTK